MSAVDAVALRKLAEDIGGDPEVMRELVQTFLEEAPRILAAMRVAAAEGDRPSLHRGAHSLKSSAGTFGAAALSRLCRELERDTERQIPQDAPARVAAAEDEWARVREALAAWRP